MKNRIATVMASFAGDALALGVHWIYDTGKIADIHGRVETLLPPGPDSYHPTKKKGDFTHYADQMLVLLESLAACKAFDPDDFSRRWRKLFENYDGYVDGATRKTLAWYEKGKSALEAGSRVSDLAGAARIAPLVHLYANDPDALVHAARTQTSMTHNDPPTLDTAEFFARVACHVLNGTSPKEAMQTVADMEIFQMSPVSMWVADGLKTAGEDSIAVISRFGQACETPQMLPGVVHLIATYENDLREALIQAVMAGGDNAARASMTGMILGAWLGMDAIPADWLEMNRKNDILSLLEQLA